MNTAETILVVDPDPAALREVSLVLAPCGYTLLTARHGTEAIRVYEGCKTPVSLLLTAVMMPGLSGFDLAENLKQWNRRLAVVFMSEHNRETLFGENARGVSHFLRKPFTEQTLLQKVRGALAEKPRAMVVSSQLAVSASRAL
ncbi:MAG: putative Hybrid sensor histidine kinase [Bryobacterales bacterium]|nr:putative Hybrid sensor histidine kinase [Bryobacterales bacterium]